MSLNINASLGLHYIYICILDFASACKYTHQHTLSPLCKKSAVHDCHMEAIQKRFELPQMVGTRDNSREWEINSA